MSKHLRFDAQVLKLLFSSISSKYILQKNTPISPNHFGIPIKDMLDTLHTRLSQYNSQELKQSLEKLCSEMKEKNDIPIFSLIFRFADSIIGRYNEKFHFSYRYCDIWRNVTLEMDEEYLVVAKAVIEDCNRQITNRSSFSWSYCIEHDNYRLSRMLCRDQGVSDNHFHLRGSSPYYYISWIMLMNDFQNNDFEDYIHTIEENRLKEIIIRGAVNVEEPMHIMRMKAAAIRLYLFAFITKSFVYFENEHISCESIRCFKLQFDGENCEKCENKDSFTLEDLGQFIRENPQYKKHYWEFWNRILYRQLMELLRVSAMPLNIAIQLQNCANMLKFQNNSFDYAISTMASHSKCHYYELAGERFILYNIMRYIHERNENSVAIERLLYLYMLMKNKFRSEMVQSNKLVGFDNFSRYHFGWS